jgi:purine-nucleoside phosphorylase
MPEVVSGRSGPNRDPMAALQEAVEAVRVKTTLVPQVGIILGTGLGALAQEIQMETAIPFGEIPNLPQPTVETHEGRLLLGTLGGVPVAAMQGRLHRYEGFDMKEVGFPVRLMKLLGADTLVVTAAAGGMNPLLELGALVLIDDHINFMGDNPLVGDNLDALGPRFPDMSEPYDRRLQALAREAALEQKLRLHEGVYVAVTGPNLETRAEYRMLRGMGADVVGMSMVPEVIVARHMDMRVLALAVVTDVCLPDALEPVDIDLIIRTAGEAEPKLSALTAEVVRRMGSV